MPLKAQKKGQTADRRHRAPERLSRRAARTRTRKAKDLLGLPTDPYTVKNTARKLGYPPTRNFHGSPMLDAPPSQAADHLSATCFNRSPKLHEGEVGKHKMMLGRPR